MSKMTLADGTKLPQPSERKVHRYDWSWTRGGTAECSCIEVIYPMPDGGSRMFLHVEMDSAYPGPKGDVLYPMFEYLVAIVNQYINDNWRLEHCDSTSAVLIREEY